MRAGRNHMAFNREAQFPERASACNRPQFCVRSIDTFQRRNRLGMPHLSAILRRIFTPAALAVPTDRSVCSSAS